MNLHPDHPDFTSVVLGEATAGEIAAFEAGLAENPAWLAESEVIRQTAGRLAGALQGSGPGVLLRPEQRRAVLAARQSSPSDAASVAASPASRPGIVTDAASSVLLSIPSPKNQADRRFVRQTGPLVATAGIAAAVAVGIFLFSGSPSPVEPKQQASNPPLPGIPVIVLDTTATASKGGAPAPGLPALPKKDPVLQPGAPLENPIPRPVPEAIATTVPDLRLVPAPSAPSVKTRDSESGDLPFPASRRRGNTGTSPLPSAGSLGSPPSSGSK